MFLAELYRENVVFVFEKVGGLFVLQIQLLNVDATDSKLFVIIRAGHSRQLSRPCYTDSDLRPTNCCLLPCQYIRQLCFDSESLKYLVFFHITEALTSCCCCCDMRKVVAYPALLFVTLTN